MTERQYQTKIIQLEYRYLYFRYVIWTYNPKGNIVITHAHYITVVEQAKFMRVG